jgi:hypothetical protein
MHRRPLRNAMWPVMLVFAASLAGCAMLSGTDADDLDPAVWQAIVDDADEAVPAILEPLKIGETK